MSHSKKPDVVDILCEFLEVAMHNILYTRGLYPQAVFARRKKYGVPVYYSEHPKINEYITDVLKAVHYHAKARQLREVLVNITSHRVPLEKFVFDVIQLENTFGGDPMLLKLEDALRTFCLKLGTSSAYLSSLPQDAEFQFNLYVSELAAMSLNADPRFGEFPWVLTKANSSSPSTEIVPIHAVDTEAIVLQMYVEKYNSNAVK